MLLSQKGRLQAQLLQRSIIKYLSIIIVVSSRLRRTRHVCRAVALYM